MKYLYVIWLKDNSLPEDDQDHEYPICIYINAENEKSALEWGDFISNNYLLNATSIEKVRSFIDFTKYDNNQYIPEINHGELPTDDKIGW